MALSLARLDWPVHSRDVLVPTREDGMREARGYKALVRPDTDDIMSVVTTTYHHAENAWVIRATADLARRASPNRNPIVGAVGFGRDHGRSLFAAKISGDADNATCLLAYNSHGGEGSIRFQIVQVNRQANTV